MKVNPCSCGGHPAHVKFDYSDGVSWQIKCDECERTSARKGVFEDAATDWNDMNVSKEEKIPGSPPFVLYYSNECRQPKSEEEILTDSGPLRTDSCVDQWLRPVKRNEWGKRWIAKSVSGNEIPMLNSEQLKALASFIADSGSSMTEKANAILIAKLAASFYDKQPEITGTWRDRDFVLSVLRAKAKKLEELE